MIENWSFQFQIKDLPNCLTLHWPIHNNYVSFNFPLFLYTVIPYGTWGNVLDRSVYSRILRCNGDGMHGCKHPKLQYHRFKTNIIISCHKILATITRRFNCFFSLTSIRIYLSTKVNRKNTYKMNKWKEGKECNIFH